VTIGRTPWRRGQPNAKPLSTKDITIQEDKDKHPCPKRDSKPRCQQPSNKGVHLRPRGQPSQITGKFLFGENEFPVPIYQNQCLTHLAFGLMTGASEPFEVEISMCMATDNIHFKIFVLIQ
jgi:hypothetical protein